ncbi:cilia- and flagella-associated protein 91 isoform X3 [Sphaeramia orbicularis]|uniref:cilia- and flagella-associated protein 91 isoform X3 n=1 Tax=Sphaeramia orbicularis TaxID=375764 RepID=UPI001180D777|nr:cilia- and flagella-associated protein 91 isoform X3 [Sphaeramia orbicularis]
MSMTRTIPRKYDANKTVRPQRVFDYLYDPVYTVSSEVDHVRASLKAYVSKDRVRKVPEYGSMFSDLAHLPRYTVQLETTDPVPPTIDRRWRGHTEQRNEVLQQLAGVAPNVSSWVRREEHSVTGADCWKYFKCPLIPTDVIFSLPMLQEARLSVLRDLLKQRDETQKEATNERLNQIHAKKQKDKDTKLHRIHNEYIRSLTKLEAKRRIAEVKLKYQQIRNSPRTHSSVTHRDVYTGRNITSAKKIKTYYCDTYEGLLELEGGLFSSVFKPQVKRPACKVIKDGIKPSDRVIQLLEQYRTLTKEAQRKKKPLKALIKKEKPVPHPVTPTVEEPPEGDEERDVAVIHLQKLLRGRSVQHKMFVGKENHLEFIMELRTVHALQKEEQELQTTEKDLITALKRQGDKHRHKTTQEEVSQAKAVGAELENLFDTLSKELIRLQQERRMHAFMLLAERNRHLREAEESGKRQAEDHKCREEDEIFRQVVQVHQETVDLYLEDIILGTVEQTADQQARQEIHTLAKEVNDVAYAMEDSRNSLQSEEIVSELVYSFLIPEIEKINVRQKVHQKQRRHWQAAGSIIQRTAEHSGNNPSLGASQLPSPS